MISTYFHGELGNNLFQLAATLCHSKKNNFDIELFYWRDYRVLVDKYPLEIQTMFDYNFNCNTDLSRFSSYDLYLHPDLDKVFEYTDIPVKDNIMLRGYFQSEKYFWEIRDDIKNKYFIPNNNLLEKMKRDWLNKYDFSKSISIHLRIGHDRNLDGNTPHLDGLFPICPISYYIDSINKILEMDSSITNIFCFSDDINWCKNNMSSDDLIFMENNTIEEDFFLMSHCSHNIIGNSTFSWWSAYLNKNPDKIVMVPYTLWFGPALSYLNKKDLFPENWIKL